MDKKEKIFTDGLIFKKPRQGAPDFVKGAISVKVPEFIAWLTKYNNNGWVNIDLKQSKTGTLYCELNNFKRDAPTTKPEPYVSSLSEEEKRQIQLMRQGKMITNSGIEYPKNEIRPEDINFE